MASLLIYNKTHWTKSATPEQKKTWTAKDIVKFSAVHEMGDIVEVREDGYFTVDHSFRKDVFAAIEDPTVSFENAKHWMDIRIREYTITEQATDIVKGEWEYRLDVIKSESGLELIDSKDLALDFSPYGLEILSNAVDYYVVKFIAKVSLHNTFIGQKNKFLDNINNQMHPVLNRIIVRRRGNVGVLSYPASKHLTIPNLTVMDKKE